MAAEDYEDEPMPYDASDRVAEGVESEGHDRVAKVLARAGVGSRREVERLIEAGRVAINGMLLTTPAIKVEPDDILTVDGEVIAGAEATRVFRYHKPVGLVTTHADPKGRPTVFSALPEGLPRLISVGRLDLASEGLLLLTNDGGLTRALELPKTGWKRIYRARAYGDATQAKLDRLKNGITVEGVSYGPIDAKLDKVTGSNCWITVTIAEGKNREVRRVLEAIGLKVNRLIRLAYGPFSLGTLAPGFVEEVGPRVIRELLADFIDPENMPEGNGVQYKAPPQAQSRRDPTLSSTSKVLAEQKPDKPVYKEGWAKPKKKAVNHVMPKRPKAKIVADFGPGKREIKAVPFRANTPLTDADRASKSHKAVPATATGRPPPKDLRPQHFKDRETAAAAEDAKALALRKALAGLDDDGPKGRARPGKPPFGKPGEKPAGKFAGKPADRPAGKFAGKPSEGDKPAGKFGSRPADMPGVGKFAGKPLDGARDKPAGKFARPGEAATGRSAGKPDKPAKPMGRHLEGKAKGHWFTAPGEAPTSRPAPAGKARPGVKPARSGPPGGPKRPGPGGPTASSAPPRTTGARPPGPPSKGGPKRRG
ncbi:MAG: pseudouridine synthase [Caulobacter sp.]|nr:pseudouridine synthase [Caulobacter sp.]